MPMPQPIHGCTVHIPLDISRPTPLILRWRLRCPDGKLSSHLYTLSGLLRKLAHVMLKRPLCARCSSCLLSHSEVIRRSDQSVAVLDESLLAQRLREDVTVLHPVVGVDVRNRYAALVALLADEVVRDLDVFGNRALRRILRLANVARVVAPQFEDGPLHPHAAPRRDAPGT